MGALEPLIEPAYPTGGRVGRQPIGVPRMLRMYFLQQWFGLAEESLEDAIYDSQATRVRKARVHTPKAKAHCSAAKAAAKEAVK